jgi:PilZ domain
MESNNGWDEQLKAIEGIAGDRREDRRYDLRLDLRWKLIRRRRLLDSGSGTSVDLSSGGVMFDAGRPLPVGLNVELSIVWPVLLQNTAPLQLIVSGRIMRVAGTCAAIQMVQHEFRTIAQAAESRSATSSQAGRTPPAMIAGSRSVFSFGKLQ